MTEREKEREQLTKLLRECVGDNVELCSESYFSWAEINYDNIADHLLSSGVIVPPVKIGQTVYPLNADPRFRAFVERIEQTANGLYFDWVQYDVGVDCTECWDEERFDVEDIGKTVFLDEIEYLKALKERSEGK